MCDELERIWKETAVAQQKYYPGSYLEGPRKTSVNMACVSAQIQTDHLSDGRLPRTLWLYQLAWSN
jgi:hypothetical protein